MFEVRRRKPRIARNPKTNARVQVPAKNVVTFKPGKEMEELIQKIQAVELYDSENWAVRFKISVWNGMWAFQD